MSDTGPGDRIRVWDARRRNWFWECNEVFDAGLTVYELVVRLYLARCASAEGYAWPSLGRVAAACGISRSTAIRALRGLEEKGWIKRYVRRGENGEYGTTVYALLDPPAEACEETGNSCKAARNEGSAGEMPPGAPETPPGISETPGSVPQILGSIPETPGSVSQILGSVPETPGSVSQIPGVVSEADSNQTHITKPINKTHITKPEESDSPISSNEEIGESSLPPASAGGRLSAGDSAAQEPGSGGDEASSSPSDRDLIAELTDRLHRIPGVEKSRGHYSLVGRALKEYGFDVVRAALEDVEAEYKGAELLGEPYPTEKELRALLFRKCRWNAKPGPRPERQEGAGEERRLRWLSFEELERLGCVLERDPEWGHVTLVRVPNEEVKERVRRARMQG